MSTRPFIPTDSPGSGLQELTELVRSQVQPLLDRMTPIAQRHSLSLDFSSIQRIDAAGAGALVSLYCTASKAGHQFSVRNASHHVAETLALVGLDAVLLNANAEHVSKSGVAVMRPFV